MSYFPLTPPANRETAKLLYLQRIPGIPKRNKKAHIAVVNSLNRVYLRGYRGIADTKKDSNWKSK